MRNKTRQKAVSKRPSSRTWVAPLILVLVLIGGVALWFQQHQQQVEPAAVSAAAAPSAPIAHTRVIYSETADPHADIQAALARAAKEHKRVVLDFGGNWCGDCQVLDIYFHDPKNLSLLESNYILVHVDIGHMDKNTDVAEKYGIPLAKGVPALAVLDSSGKLLYNQQHGEFEAMRRMDEASVTEFLNRWKPAA